MMAKYKCVCYPVRGIQVGQFWTAKILRKGWLTGWTEVPRSVVFSDSRDNAMRRAIQKWEDRTRMKWPSE